MNYTKYMVGSAKELDYSKAIVSTASMESALEDLDTKKELRSNIESIPGGTKLLDRLNDIFHADPKEVGSKLSDIRKEMFEIGNEVNKKYPDNKKATDKWIADVLSEISETQKKLKDDGIITSEEANEAFGAFKYAKSVMLSTEWKDARETVKAAKEQAKAKDYKTALATMKTAVMKWRNIEKKANANSRGKKIEYVVMGDNDKALTISESVLLNRLADRVQSCEALINKYTKQIGKLQKVAEASGLSGLELHRYMQQATEAEIAIEGMSTGAAIAAYVAVVTASAVLGAAVGTAIAHIANAGTMKKCEKFDPGITSAAIGAKEELKAAKKAKDNKRVIAAAKKMQTINTRLEKAMLKAGIVTNDDYFKENQAKYQRMINKHTDKLAKVSEASVYLNLLALEADEELTEIEVDIPDENVVAEAGKEFIDADINNVEPPSPQDDDSNTAVDLKPIANTSVTEEYLDTQALLTISIDALESYYFVTEPVTEGAGEILGKIRDAILTLLRAIRNALAAFGRFIKGIGSKTVEVSRDLWITVTTAVKWAFRIKEQDIEKDAEAATAEGQKLIAQLEKIRDKGTTTDTRIISVRGSEVEAVQANTDKIAQDLINMTEKITRNTPKTEGEARDQATKIRALNTLTTLLNNSQAGLRSIVPIPSDA